MAGLHPTSRERLEKLHRAFHGPFHIPDAADVLALSERQTRRFLARLAASAWLVRLKPGLYTTVPLGAGEQGEWQEDPWRLAGKLYAPCYVAGWSACEHWGLTEQVFRSIVVVTAKQVRAPEEVVQGTTFRLKHLDEKRIFGTATAWRGRAPVPVSDPARTILDALAFPVLCGGIRHVSEVLDTYMQSSMRDDDLLLDYAERFGNRSVYKRLGYLLEQLAIDAPRVIAACTARMSTGVVPLDPSGPSDGRITSRWRLKVNVRIPSDGEDR